MDKAQASVDGTAVGAEDSVHVVKINGRNVRLSPEEARQVVEQLNDQGLDVSAVGINQDPAMEEGPHLKGDNARLKREQLEAAGIRASDDRLPTALSKLLEG